MNLNLYFNDHKLILATLIQLLIVFSFASASPVLYSLTFILVFFYAVNFDFLKNFRNWTILYVAIYLGVIFSIIFFKFSEDPNLIFKSVFTFIGIFAATFFLNDKKLLYYSSAFALFLFQIFVFANIFYYGFDNYPVDDPLKKIFDGKSGNGITSYTIILQLHFLVAHIVYDKRVNSFLYISIVSTLLICMSTYARGSLISALLIILIVNLIYKFSFKFLYFICGIVLLFFLTNMDDVLDFINRNSKLSQGFEDYDRIEALNQYVRKIDFYSILNGANYDETIIDRELNGNPHNSFIRAHHNYGLLYVIFILSTIFLCIFTNQSFKKIILYGSIMLVLVFRIWTEPILFPTILDFYFFSIFFTIYNYEPKLIRI